MLCVFHDGYKANWGNELLVELRRAKASFLPIHFKEMFTSYYTHTYTGDEMLFKMCVSVFPDKKATLPKIVIFLFFFAAMRVSVYIPVTRGWTGGWYRVRRGEN